MVLKDEGHFFFPAGLKFFTLNDYSIQFVFYFIYINLQVSLAFLVAGFFSTVNTATGLISANAFCSGEKDPNIAMIRHKTLCMFTLSVVGYIMVFGTGLLGGFLFQFFLQDSSFPRK